MEREKNECSDTYRVCVCVCERITHTHTHKQQREAEREVNLSVVSERGERGGQQVVGFSPLSSSTSHIHPLSSKFFSFTPSQRPHLPLLSLSLFPPSLPLFLPFPHHFLVFTRGEKREKFRAPSLCPLLLPLLSSLHSDPSFYSEKYAKKQKREREERGFEGAL